MLNRKQYCWTMDENAKGYCCIFVYIRENEDGADEEVRVDLKNPNHAISFHKLLIEADYKYKQIQIQTAPAWAR